MSDTGTMIILVILTVIATILLNLLLVASVRSSARRTDGKMLRQMVRSIRSPFQSTDADLDELADLIEKVKKDNNPSEQTD